MVKLKKIGIDIRSIGQQRTGDEYYTLNLVRGLLEIDEINQYFLFTNTRDTKETENKILKNLKNKNFKIIPVLPRFKILWTFFLLPFYVRRLNLDVLHVQYITPLWLPKKTKLITTIADVSFKKYPELINKIDLILLNIFIPLSLKRADIVIAVSNFTKKEIVKYFNVAKNKIKVIYNGGASEDFFKKNNHTRKILKKIGIKPPFIFYVGTHQPRKDIPTLMKAFFSLKLKKEYFKNFQLVIGGKLKAHNYDCKIDELITEFRNNSDKRSILNDLIFTGYLENEDLVGLYREADLFVFPSLYEGFGLPLIEAMASEVPVVCSDIDCFKEIGGKAVEFYEKGNANDLEDKIYQISVDQKNKIKLKKEGKKQARRYSWEKTAHEMLEVFNKDC